MDLRDRKRLIDDMIAANPETTIGDYIEALKKISAGGYPRKGHIAQLVDRGLLFQSYSILKATPANRYENVNIDQVKKYRA